jgi:tetratricopeptide (TPR) repeat protein
MPVRLSYLAINKTSQSDKKEIFMKLNGTMTLEQIKKMHDEACALNPENEAFEDTESSETVRKNIKIAWDYFNDENFEKSNEYFNNALEIKPHSEFALLEYGTSFAYRGDFEMAIKKYKEVIKINKKCADAYYNLGNVYMKLYRLDIGLKNIEKALNINIGHKMAFAAFVRIYDDFYRVYNNSFRYQTNLLEQAMVSVRQSRFLECVNFLTILLFFEPKNIKAHFLHKIISIFHMYEIRKAESPINDLESLNDQ